MKEGIKKEYEKLGKKYELPKFNAIDAAFEISTIENTGFLLRGVIGKVMEKIGYYAKFLEEFLQPDTSSLSSMHEIRFFSDEEKVKLYQLYKKLMKISRESIEVDLAQDEKDEARFISDSLKEWNEMKKELAWCAAKMKESWDKETNKEEEVGYFG